MLLELDFSADVPIYQQIRNQIVIGIAEGRLRAGEHLPTIRALASEAGINMMTANKAYALLKQEGYITADRRSGAVVSGPVKHNDIKHDDIKQDDIKQDDIKHDGTNPDVIKPDSEEIDGVIPSNIHHSLKLLIAEAKLSGVTKQAFWTLCEQVYREMERGSE